MLSVIFADNFMLTVIAIIYYFDVKNIVFFSSNKRMKFLLIAVMKLAPAVMTVWWSYYKGGPVDINE